MQSSRSYDSNRVILAFEASTSCLSVSVAENTQSAALVTAVAPLGQAADLVPMAVRAMADSGFTFDHVTHVAAGVGPGSFTGIRVALAAAKGICLAQNVRGIGISGLQAMAFSGLTAASGRTILSFSDTRRGSLYAQAFSKDAVPVGNIVEGQPDQLPLLLLPSLAAGDIALVGHAADLMVPIFKRYGRTAVILPPDYDSPNVLQGLHAGMIARLAAHQLAAGVSTPLTPLYLADPRLGPKKAGT